MIHIHLDPVGGIAGDMFIAAMLHVFPNLQAPMLMAIRAAGLPPEVGIEVKAFQDFALTGLRFIVDEPDQSDMAISATSNHDHRAFANIREQLLASAVEEKVRERALAIFTLLAEVEGQIHGVATSEVSFHELGGWDSIADIVGAAFLIEACGAVSWSIGSLPKGSGTVKTAHGPLPVPSPATARLLEGFALHDDGRSGERVTPTGAAIVRHLRCGDRLPAGGLRLTATGYGFGSRRFMGMSNTLRATVFDNNEKSDFIREDIAKIEFELDDQTAEDIALALSRLRDLHGVLDVLQMPVYAKKGRLATHVQLLCTPQALDAALTACFRQTGTLGIRYQLCQRAVLPREDVTVIMAERELNVKVAQRPSGEATAKLEADSVDQSAADSRAAREALRQRAEQIALEKKK